MQPVNRAHLSLYRPFGAFRLLLALLVVLQHALLLLDTAGRSVFYDLELGAVAVAVFFALSGFIMAESTAIFYAARPGAFLANRVLRLVPPYLAALALTVAIDSMLFAAGRLVPLDAPLMSPPWHGRVLLAALLEIVPGLSVQRISGQAFSFIPFAWTLRVEFVFYLVMAATLWAMLRAPSRRRWVAGGAFLAGYALFAGFLWRTATLGRAGGALQFVNVPFFAFGVCAFRLLRHGSAGRRAHLLFVSACVPVAFVLCGERGHPVLAYQLPILFLLLAALLALARAPSPGERWRAWDRRCGELSYPLYIGHGAVLTLLASVGARQGLPIYLVAVGGSLWLAVVLHTLVEMPLRRLRERIRGQAVG